MKMKYLYLVPLALGSTLFSTPSAAVSVCGPDGFVPNCDQIVELNLVYCTGGDCKGTSDNDCIIGTDGEDFIDAGKGIDFISGGDGNDYISGGQETDIICGGAGNDVIEGGQDEDYVNGESGNDMIDGGQCNDTIVGGDDDDQCLGGQGLDDFTGCEVIEEGKQDDQADSPNCESVL